LLDFISVNFTFSIDTIKLKLLKSLILIEILSETLSTQYSLFLQIKKAQIGLGY